MFAPKLENGKIPPFWVVFLVSMAVGFGIVMGIFNNARNDSTSNELNSSPRSYASADEGNVQTAEASPEADVVAVDALVYDPSQSASGSAGDPTGISSSASENTGSVQNQSIPSEGSFESQPSVGETSIANFNESIGVAGHGKISGARPLGIIALDIDMNASVKILPEDSVVSNGDSVIIDPPFDKDTVYWWSQSGRAGYGATDSVTIFGHNSIIYGDYTFSKLGSPNSRPGMTISIDTDQGRVDYIVTEVMRGKDRGALLNDSNVQDYKPGYNDLVLVTCDNVTWYGQSTENIVVLAKLA